MYHKDTLDPYFIIKFSLLSCGEKKKIGKKRKKKNFSIIPQVPVASSVFLPYYKYVLFAGHLSSEIKLRQYSQPKEKINCTT